MCLIFPFLSKKSIYFERGFYGKKTYEVDIRVRVLIEANDDRDVKKFIEGMDVGALREHSAVRGAEFMVIAMIRDEDGNEKFKW